MNMKSLIIVFVIMIPAICLSQSSREKVAEGNELFNQERFDEANNKYRDALLDDPESPKIHFNIGATQYKKKKYEEALTEFEKSLSTDDILLQAKNYYNMGNTMYRMGKLPEAILAYTQALKYNPDDVDAKYNLEYVRKKLKDQADKQQQQQNNQQQQQQQQQEQQQQQQQGDENKEEQQEEQQQQQQEQQEQQQQEEEQQQQPQPQEQEMSKEDAERILNALKNDEKDLQKQRKAKTSGNFRVLKDW